MNHDAQAELSCNQTEEATYMEGWNSNYVIQFVQELLHVLLLPI